METCFKKCFICGKPLPFNHKKYCSNECYIEGTKRARRERKPHNCIICGKSLPDFKKKYCSEQCRKKSIGLAAKDLSTANTGKKALSTERDLSSMVKAALEHHMSYGKYIEMLEKQNEHRG